MMDIIDVKKSTEAPTTATDQAIRRTATKSKYTKNNIVLFILGVVVLIAIVASGYFYKQYQDVKKNPAQAITEKNSVETDQVLVSLKAVLLVEETEKPTVARVETPETLKKNNETFYKNIQKGDYIILYPTRAIIYRKDTNQIINMAPIVKSSDLKASEATPTTQPTGTTNTNKTTR